MASKLGKYIQTRENLESVAKESWKFGREKFVAIGLSYFKEHPEDIEQIRANLAYFNLDTSSTAIDKVLIDTAVHYYEKLFVLTKQYEAYWIAKNRVEIGTSLEPIRKAQQNHQGVFVGQSHFGVTYLLPSVFMVNDIDITSVGFFPPPVGDLLKQNTTLFAEKFKTGHLTMVNLADKTISPPLMMLQKLNEKQVVMNVFDEYNSLCKPVSLFGKPIYGGTGMDQILSNYKPNELLIATPFLIRTSEDQFRLELDYHSLESTNIIQDFFNALEKRVRLYPEQWYFIQEVHENMPNHRYTQVILKS